MIIGAKDFKRLRKTMDTTFIFPTAAAASAATTAALLSAGAILQAGW